MKIAIIDDIPTDRRMAAEFVQDYFTQSGISLPVRISMYETGEAFLAQFVPCDYHIIFIDYYLDRLSGMDVARSIRKEDSSVILIFITASRDFAVEGYKVKASGYLVKPLSYAGVSEILSLIDLRRLRKEQAVELNNGCDTIKVMLGDIVYCDISGHYVQFHMVGGGLRRVRMPFRELAGRLAPYREFLLCYRGCIINLDMVHKVEDFAFLMAGGERVPFRRREYQKMLQMYSDYMFEKARSDCL